MDCPGAGVLALVRMHGTHPVVVCEKCGRTVEVERPNPRSQPIPEHSAL